MDLLQVLDLDHNPLSENDKKIYEKGVGAIIEYCKNIKEKKEIISEIDVKRGGEVQGGKYIYKIKIKNNTAFNITDLNFQIVSYPKDSIKLIGNKSREISKLDANGFVSPTFEFQPTKDCIEGVIHSIVTYIDQLNNLHTINIEPYKISIICGLLQPKKIEVGEFIKITQELLNYDKAGEEIIIPYNSKLIFEKLKVLLPDQNFMFVTKPESKIIGNNFIGEINGFAEGKYSKNSIGLKITISGIVDQDFCSGLIDCYAENKSMLSSLILELSDRITNWYCLKCKGPLKKENVELILKNQVIECEYCGYVINKLI